MTKNIIKLAFSAAVSFAIIALMLQLFTQGLSDEERPSIIDALRNTTFAFLGFYFVLYFIQLWVRSYRYRQLLKLGGEPNLPSMWQMAIVTAVRNMLVDMFPARAGELGYVGLLNRGYGVKLEHCVSSLGLAIVFDFIALFFIALMVVASQLLFSQLQGWALGALLMILLVSVTAFFTVFRIGPALVHKWFDAKDMEPTSWRAKFVNFTHDFTASIEQVRESKQLVTITVLSIMIRVLKYAGMYFLF
ncbi:MAG: lysylphosphatidylglycerol synthase domain-containing protein, partial [Pseudomonadota bacterium]